MPSCQIPALTLVLSFTLPVLAFCQGTNEYAVHMRTGMLLNRPDTRHTYNKPAIYNSLQQAIGFKYSRITRSGMIASAGLDLGYERYKIKVGEGRSGAYLYRNYEQKATIHYAQANVNLGYRFKSIKRFTPEIRVGQILHLPIKYKSIGPETIVDAPVPGHASGTGTYIDVNGQFGKSGPNIIGELLNNIYLGCKLPQVLAGVKHMNLGINVQRQLFLHSVNHYTITHHHYTPNGWVPSVTETFKGRHFVIALQVDVRL